MAIKRIVSTEFWTDRKVVEQFAIDDRLFFLYLLTNPHTTQIGIYPFVIKIASFETGFNADVIMNLLERFESNYGLIRCSNRTGEIAIKNYLRHSIVKGGTPVKDLLDKEAANVKDRALLKFVLDANQQNDNMTVRQFVEEQTLKLQEPNDNDNDNDNEESLPIRSRFVHDSSKPSKINDSSKKEPKHQYGEYKNVLLTDAEIEKLKAEFGDYLERIERLSEYIESKGASYKSHLATIRAWSKRDKTESKEPVQNTGVWARDMMERDRLNGQQSKCD